MSSWTDLKHDELLPLPQCPHCGVKSPALERKFFSHFTAVVSNLTRDWSLFFCRSCGGAVVVGGPHGKGGMVEEIIPEPKSIPPEIPTKPRAFLQQALDTLHAPSASIMVAASAVDAMLKERKLVKGSLYDRIKKAEENHLITGEMAQWAHDVRLDANDERHADNDAGPPGPEDARRCFDFAMAFAEYLFVLPAKVARGRKSGSP